MKNVRYVGWHLANNIFALCSNLSQTTSQPVMRRFTRDSLSVKVLVAQSTDGSNRDFLPGTAVKNRFGQMFFFSI